MKTIAILSLAILAGCASPTTHSMSSHENTTRIGKVDYSRVSGSGLGIGGGPDTGPAECADCDEPNTKD